MSNFWRKVLNLKRYTVTLLNAWAKMTYLHLLSYRRKSIYVSNLLLYRLSLWTYKLILPTAKLLGSENKLSRARTILSITRIRILWDEAPSIVTFGKSLFFLILKFWLLPNYNRRFLISYFLNGARTTRRKNLSFFLFAFLRWPRVREIKSQASLPIHIIRKQRVTKQFALIKSLINVSKKEKRRILKWFLTFL